MARRDCQTCLGAGRLARTSEALLPFTCATISRIRGLYEASRRTLRHARVYRGEQRENDRRILACVVQVRAYRISIRYHRELLRGRAGEALATCAACRGLGLADISCQGCGGPVAIDTLDEFAFEHLDVLVHQLCDAPRVLAPFYDDIASAGAA